MLHGWHQKPGPMQKDSQAYYCVPEHSPHKGKLDLGVMELLCVIALAQGCWDSRSFDDLDDREARPMPRAHFLHVQLASLQSLPKSHSPIGKKLEAIFT